MDKEFTNEINSFSQSELEELLSLRDSMADNCSVLVKAINLTLYFNELVKNKKTTKKETHSELLRLLGITSSSEKSKKPIKTKDENGDVNEPVFSKNEKMNRSIYAYCRDISKALSSINKTNRKIVKEKIDNLPTSHGDDMQDNISEDGDDCSSIFKDMPEEFTSEIMAIKNEAEQNKYGDVLLSQKDEQSIKELERVKEELFSSPINSISEEIINVPLNDNDIPESERNGLQKTTELTTRIDASVEIKNLSLLVEKATNPLTGYYIRASVSHIGPENYNITWKTLVNIVHLVCGYALPIRRVEKLLGNQIAASSMCEYIDLAATNLSDIYLHLFKEVSNACILSGDSAAARINEWKRLKNNNTDFTQPFLIGTLSKKIDKLLPFLSKRKDDKNDKDDNNYKTKAHVTVLTGKQIKNDTHSTIILYRTHIGDLGNLLDYVLPFRKTANNTQDTLVIQSDLSSANKVNNKGVLSKTKIIIAGCSSHARRPFWRYREQDKWLTSGILTSFKGVAMYEKLLTKHGRNNKNVDAVRKKCIGMLYWIIKKYCEAALNKWSDSTALGKAIRYFLKNWDAITYFLYNPSVSMDNNFCERLVRYEKLMDKSSFGRDTIEGRTRYDIIRTFIQTCTAANVNFKQYLLFIMLSDKTIISDNPQFYTPFAFRQLANQEKYPNKKLATEQRLALLEKVKKILP